MLKIKNSTLNIVTACFFASAISCGGGSENNSSLPETVELPTVSAGNFETLRATIKMKEIPEVLVTKDINDANSISVAVLLDANNDGVYSEGDLKLSIGYFTSTDTNETTLTSSLLETLSSPYEGLILLANIEYIVNGDELTFIVDKSQAEELNQISTQTQVNISIAYQQNSQSSTSVDYIPAPSEYTQVQNISVISDDVLDYEGDNSIIDISEFRIDFE